MGRSVWAVVAGVVFIIVVTSLVDMLLHQLNVYPPVGQPLTDATALIASSYRFVITVAGAWITSKVFMGPDAMTRPRARQARVYEMRSRTCGGGPGGPPRYRCLLRSPGLSCPRRSASGPRPS